MPYNPASVQEIIGMVNSLSEKHVLKRMPSQYVADFANAAVYVYDQRKIGDILQHKFHIPDDSTFTEHAYLESASELSVANHIKSAAVSDFDTEKRVNPTSKKDVDVYYQVGCTRVSLEVKCPQEEEQLVFPGNISVRSAGRLEGYKETAQKLISTLSATSSSNIFEGKNPDNRLKDALVGAHDKFRPTPELNDLNVLFLACGDYYKMSEWHGCLYGKAGLFTNESFHPFETYSNVDCVVLSNLKYRLQVAFDFPAWSLDEVLIIPIQNPHRRKNLFDSTVAEGLSIFNHYRKEFLAERIVKPGVEEVQEFIGAHTKVTWFVDRQLDSAKRKRFFPVTPTSGTLPTQ